MHKNVQCGVFDSGKLDKPETSKPKKWLRKWKLMLRCCFLKWQSVGNGKTKVSKVLSMRLMTVGPDRSSSGKFLVTSESPKITFSTLWSVLGKGKQVNSGLRKTMHKLIWLLPQWPDLGQFPEVWVPPSDWRITGRTVWRLLKYTCL